MIPALATLETLPHGHLINLVREELIAVAEDIRRRQDAAVAERIMPEWSDRLRGQYFALKAAADALLVILADCRDAKARGREAPAHVGRICGALRAALIAGGREIEAGEASDVDPA